MSVYLYCLVYCNLSFSFSLSQGGCETEANDSAAAKDLDQSTVLLRAVHYVLIIPFKILLTEICFFDVQISKYTVP